MRASSEYAPLRSQSLFVRFNQALLFDGTYARKSVIWRVAKDHKNWHLALDVLSRISLFLEFREDQVLL
jgi:hypothetical protein